MEDGTGGVSGMVRTQKNAGVMVKTNAVKKAGTENIGTTIGAVMCARKARKDASSTWNSEVKILRRLFINQSSRCVDRRTRLVMIASQVTLQG